MTKEKHEVEGFKTTTKGQPAVKMAPYDPRLKHMKKEDALKIKEQRKEADKAAQVAYDKVYQDAKKKKAKEPKPEKAVLTSKDKALIEAIDRQREKVLKLRSELADLKRKIAACKLPKEEKEKDKLERKLTRLSPKMEDEENELEKLEVA